MTAVVVKCPPSISSGSGVPMFAKEVAPLVASQINPVRFHGPPVTIIG